MYARVSTTQMKPGSLDSAEGKALIKSWQDLTVGQKKEGGKGGLLLVDRSKNKVVSISMWNTEADLKASEKGHRERVKKGNPLWASTPTHEQYEIATQV